jgi:lysophospholipase L1-like esterase
VSSIRNAARASALGIAVLVLAGVAVPAASDAASAPLRIYPLGDSITYGMSPRNAAPGGYRSVLDVALTQASVAHQFVGTSTANPSVTLTRRGQAAHDGHIGFRIDQVDADLDGRAGTADDNGGGWLTGTATRGAIDPQAVLVHLGTNDVAQKFDPGNTYDDDNPFDEPDERARFVTSMTGRLATLLDEVERLRPGVVLYVATVIPAATGTLADQVIADYAVSVRALVQQRAMAGDRMVLVDAYAAFLGPDGRPAAGFLSVDGVHPTAAGYSVLGRAFSDALIAQT